jgi:hypothetical protein
MDKVVIVGAGGGWFDGICGIYIKIRLWKFIF